MSNLIECTYTNGRFYSFDVALCSDMVNEKFDELYKLEGTLEDFNFEIATHLTFLAAFEVLIQNEWLIEDILKGLLECHPEIKEIILTQGEVKDGD